MKATAILFLSLLMSLCFGQKISSLTLSPAFITGGGKVTGTVTLTSKATGTGVSVPIIDTSGLTTFPSSVTIPGGKTSATFTVTTYPEKLDVNAEIVASLNTGSKSAKLLIKAPEIASLSLNPTSITGGNKATGTITLTGTTGAGIELSLKSNSAEVSVPSSVTIGANESSVTFSITTQAVAAASSCLITAKQAGYSAVSATIKISPPTLQGFLIAPNQVVGGTGTYGAITLTGPAPKGGVKVTITSSSKMAAVLPYITITQGTTSGIISIQTSPVSVDTPCKVTVKVGTASIAETVTIQRVAMSSLTISPTKVQGGTTATATILLNGKAGSSGFPLKLSSDQAFATVPATKTISAGLIGSTVTISTSKVTTTGIANITVTDSEGVSLKATITVGLLGTGLAVSAWPKFHHDNTNSGLGIGNSAAGTVAWKFATQGGIASSPAIGPDGTIYFGSNDSNFYAIDGTTGKVKWKYPTGGTIDSSPSVSADGTVYFGGWDGSFYALDATTGKFKWSYPVNSYVSSGVAIDKDGTVIFGCADKTVYAVNGATGGTKWSYQTGGSVVTTPTIGPDDTVYFGSDDKLMYAINGSTGGLKWSFQTNGSILSSAALSSDGTLYFGSYDSNLYAVDSATGSGKSILRLTREIISSPIIGADGTIYFGCSDSKFYAVNSQGAPVWKFAADSEMISSPVMTADGVIYVTSNAGTLYAIDSAAATPAWTYKLSLGARSSVAIGNNGMAFVGSLDGNLYAIK